MTRSAGPSDRFVPAARRRRAAQNNSSYWVTIWCLPICPNLPYTEIYVTLPIEDGTEPMSVLDEEVKENQRREAVIWQQETALRRLKAKLAKLKNWAEKIVIYSSS